VWTVLNEALHLAQATGELQRLGPVRAARAEAFWLEGKRELALEEVHEIYNHPLGKEFSQRLPRFLGEFAYWRWKLGDLKELSEGIPRPFTLQIEGKLL
jgi:hypothetical protein